jgi:tripeptide aminopeptidase
MTTQINPSVEAACQTIRTDSKVAQALEAIRANATLTFQWQKEITEIPAPPRAEANRARDYLKRVQDLGLGDARIDAEGNVVGVRKGVGDGRPKLVISAHLDTALEVPDVKVKEKDGRFHAHGIGDDGRGLATLLAVLQSMNRSDLRTRGDIMFVASVGEEGIGDLRGVKALFRDHQDIDGFISVDELGVVRIIVRATGSRRHEIAFKGPGGHSFNLFGRPSAIHAMGRAIAKISDIHPPTDPKTTFTVGQVTGGQAVNAIADNAIMRIDMRSSRTEELSKLEQTVLRLVDEAVAEENARWKPPDEHKIAVKVIPIGDRPGGATAEDSIIVQAARSAVAAVGGGPEVHLIEASTDANIAMSRGVPAVTVGGGGEGDGEHTPDEWFKPIDEHLGPQSVLLMALVLVGLQGVSEPLLAVRP